MYYSKASGKYTIIQEDLDKDRDNKMSGIKYQSPYSSLMESIK